MSIEDDYSFISSVDIISLTSEEELTFTELMKKAHKPLQLYHESQYSKRKLKLMANKWIDDLLKGEFSDDYIVKLKLQEAKKHFNPVKSGKPAKDT